ncbi:unnamed protein product [Arabidopsis lyrata]|nr:unnamed protein product [Arabidopsis lyrata]
MKGGESKAEATSTDQRLKTRGRKPGKKTKKDPNQPKRPPSERKKKIYGFEF